VAIRAHWKRHGPPLNVAVHIVGMALGIKWTEGDEPAAPPPSSPGPTIAELAAMTPPPR